MKKQSTISTAILEQNNEAVSLIKAGQFEKANAILVDALRTLRGDTLDDEKTNSQFNSILSVDLWMASSDAVLRNRLPGALTDPFFVYNHGIPIPTNFFQDSSSQYCPVDSTAAVASAMFFNQGLACHLLYIQHSSVPSSNPTNDSKHMESLRQATDLYRIAIQSSQHMRNSISRDLSRKVNEKFFLAAINNLAVSDRVQFILSQHQKTSSGKAERPNQPKASANRYFESLRNFLSLHQPERKKTADDELWNFYVSNAHKGNNMLQPSFCASAG